MDEITDVLETMKHQDLINELREELAGLVLNLEGASAMQMYDLNRLTEDVVLGLLRDLFDLPNLRNLNATEQKNFPGIDLADDTKRVAVQVTATATLDKVKDTLMTFVNHGLMSNYDKLLIYVITHKQSSYSQAAIDTIVKGNLEFQAKRDILDFRDALARAIHLPPVKVQSAVEFLRSYSRGTPSGLLEADFDPPTEKEEVYLNLLEVFFPFQLYIAEVLSNDSFGSGLKRVRNQRKAVREHLKDLGLWAPIEFEFNAGRIITFHNLEDHNNPFASVIDFGTVTPIRSVEFSSIDDDHDRLFKSLLRRCLQNKLYKHRVEWKDDDKLFIFLPRQEGDLLREETWVSTRVVSRDVFVRKLNKKDPDKTFVCKHFSFGVDFVNAEGKWFAALMPDWFFSYGVGYRRSLFADENLSWLKRRENNRTVTDHFRFLAYWLSNLDTEDLFSLPAVNTPNISFGEIVSLDNHPALDDERWLPVKVERVQETDLFDESHLFDFQ